MPKVMTKVMTTVVVTVMSMMAVACKQITSGGESDQHRNNND